GFSAALGNAGAGRPVTVPIGSRMAVRAVDRLEHCGNTVAAEVRTTRLASSLVPGAPPGRVRRFREPVRERGRAMAESDTKAETAPAADIAVADVAVAANAPPAAAAGQCHLYLVDGSGYIFRA